MRSQRHRLLLYRRVRLVVLAIVRHGQRPTEMQRQEPVASSRFLAAQFYGLWNLPATVRVDRQATHGCRSHVSVKTLADRQMQGSDSSQDWLPKSADPGSWIKSIQVG